MLEHHAMDLGSVNATGRAPTGYALTGSNTWRRALAVSDDLIARGVDRQDVILRTLAALRPCTDAGDPAVRAHATLSYRDWVELDDRVGMAFQEELNGVADLQSRGLRTNLGNPFGTPIYEYQKASEFSAANLSMYASTPPTDDRINYTLTGLPVPVISKGFFLDERVLQAGRRSGQGIDVTAADAATRAVAEMLESLLFTGGDGTTQVTHGGYTLAGYTNATGINTGSLTASWLTLSTANPMGIITDLITMKQACRSDFVNGPFMVYVPLAWIDALGRSYWETTAASPTAVTGLVAPSQTIMQRMMAVEGILGVKPTSQLTSGVVLVDMNVRTVDMIFGFEPRLISWESQGGLGNHFRVLSIMSFRVRTDYSGRSGVAYYT